MSTWQDVDAKSGRRVAREWFSSFSLCMSVQFETFIKNTLDFSDNGELDCFDNSLH